MSDELIEVYFEGTIKLSRDEIEEAGGDFDQAVQNMAGGSGVIVQNAQDEYDNYTLEQHDESESLCD